MTEKFVLPELGFAYNALESAIDAQTMEIHHGKHHAAYVNNLNVALEKAPVFFGSSVEDILRNLNDVPEEIRVAVRNNGGGHANHSLFWQILKPGGKNMPFGDLAKEIDATFGNFDGFVDTFSKAAVSRFGSGWAWLVVDDQKKLQVYSTANQDSPLIIRSFSCIWVLMFGNMHITCDIKIVDQITSKHFGQSLTGIKSTTYIRLPSK